MNSRFKPDDESSASSQLIDSESLDASEQNFAASTLESEQRPVEQRFIVETSHSEETQPKHDKSRVETSAMPSPQAQPLSTASGSSEPALALPPELILQPDAGAWRQEVAAKVNRYKARKPRPPRYPSLQLKFEPRESPWRDSARDERSETSDAQGYSAHNRHAVAVQQSSAVPQALPREDTQAFVHASAFQKSDFHALETSARILEFPRALVLPSTLDELAEPVSDKPRILDVPDHAPPPPALGGISIEPIEQIAEEKRPGIDIPLQSAVMSRRLSAVAIDAFLVAFASTLFGYVFFRITNAIPSIREGITPALTLTGVFWAAYQYLLLVHTGTTPGLKLAKLQLRRFDGSAVSLKGRRWRVLASLLSGVSLGIGYLWCFLDEDQLCWHDRITHTYMAPRSISLADASLLEVDPGNPPQ
jgi:uncharacterized RDD family membrane protein YckC